MTRKALFRTGEAVQEVHAAKAVYCATRGIVVANREFTRNARELARSTGVELWGRHKLAEMIIKATPAADTEPRSLPQPEPAPAAEIFPRCGGPLVLRSSSRGKFWGCSGYPRCRFTRDCSAP